MNKGKLGELIAKAYLIRKGFKLIYSNYFSNGGEIDIIATSTQYHVHFIEVKYYGITNWIHPIQAVTQKKKNKIKHTATHFLNQSCVDYKDTQFDIIIIEKGTVKHHVLYAF
jgi:putative endonuclease